MVVYNLTLPCIKIEITMNASTSVITKQDYPMNMMHNMPLTLPYQMLQVRRVHHMLQHPEVQSLHCNGFPVLEQFLETAFKKHNHNVKSYEIQSVQQSYKNKS